MAAKLLVETNLSMRVAGLERAAERALQPREMVGWERSCSSRSVGKNKRTRVGAAAALTMVLDQRQNRKNEHETAACPSTHTFLAYPRPMGLAPAVLSLCWAHPSRPLFLFSAAPAPHASPCPEHPGPSVPIN